MSLMTPLPLSSSILLLLLLGRVALVAQRPIVIKLSRERLSVCLCTALWKNGESDPDAVWYHVARVQG